MRCEPLRKPLNSPINWVRNQALTLIGGSQTGARAVGSDLATEIGYDLANGLFPLRLPAYWKAAFSAKNRGSWWSLFMGTFCYFTNLIFLLTAAVIIYYGFWSLGSVEPFNAQSTPLYNIGKQIIQQIVQFKETELAYYDEDQWKIPAGALSNSQPIKEKLSNFPINIPSINISPIKINFSILKQPVFIVISFIIVIAVTGYCFNKNPSLLWLAILGSTTGIAVLISIFAALWAGQGAAFLAIFFILHPDGILYLFEWCFDC